MNFKRYAIFICILVMLLAIISLSTACEQHKHSYEWTETLSPTCESDGSETGTCVCGETTTRKIPAKGHKWSDFSVSELPTEEKEGVATSVCLNDDSHIHTINLPVLGDERYEKTTDEKGFNITYSFSFDDEITAKKNVKIEFTICIHEHTFNCEVIHEATCTSEGLRKFTCTHPLCGDVVEEIIPKKAHIWTTPEIKTLPEKSKRGLAIVKCEYDENGDHIREYILPSLNSFWKDYTIENDETQCVYNGYRASLDSTDSTVYNLSLTVTDPLLEYDCEPVTFEINFTVQSNTHLHIYGDFGIEKMPTGVDSGLAVSYCQINEEHSLKVNLPSFNSASSQKYSYSIEDDTVYWSIKLSDPNYIEHSFNGSYEKPSSISLKIGVYGGSFSEEIYNDRDIIPLRVGDYPQTIQILTPLCGKELSKLTIRCVNAKGQVVQISDDMMKSTALQDKGLLIDGKLLKSNGLLYFKDFCPDVHYLTIEADDDLKSTFKIEPVFDAPTGQGSSVLIPQTYNVKQQAWNSVKRPVETYRNTEIIVGAGADIYVDSSCTVNVFDSENTDRTSEFIVREEIFGAKKGFVFSTNIDGEYRIVLTSTRTPSHSVNFNIRVLGNPTPETLFSEDYLFTYVSNRSKYVVRFSEIANDLEANTSSGKATLTVEGRGKLTVPFTYTYNDGTTVFTSLSTTEYGLRFNSNYELLLAYEDPFTGDIDELSLEKVILINNSVEGSYAFADNPNTESSEMQVNLVVNQSGVYKFSIKDNYVCINVNDAIIYENASEFDYIVGKRNGVGENELEITLYEGDSLLIYNHGKLSSNLTVTLKEELKDTFSGVYKFDSTTDSYEFIVAISGSYTFTIDTSYVLYGVNIEGNLTMQLKTGYVGLYNNRGKKEISVELKAGDKIKFLCASGDTCTLTVEKE